MSTTTSVQEITTQFSRYSRFIGGSLRLVAYLALLLTIGAAVLAMQVIAPFRDGQAKGIYWSLILFDEVATRYLLPVSAAAIVLLLALPFINWNKPNRRPAPGLLKLFTAMLIFATLAAWVVIGLNLFKTNRYDHIHSLLANDHLYHIATKLENTKNDKRYLVYSCDKTELNCSLIYSQVFPEGKVSLIQSQYTKTVTLRYDEARRQLVLVWPQYKDQPDVYIPIPANS